MIIGVEIKVLLVLLISAGLFFPINSSGDTRVRYGVEGGFNNQTEDSITVAMATPPQYTEVELTSLDGDIYFNPEYVGKVRSVRTIDRSGLLGDRVEIEVRILTDGWRKFSLPPSLSNAFGVIISGDRGILKISLPVKPSAPGAGDISPIKRVLIEFGTLNKTFALPGLSILEPSKYGIGILDNKDESFIGARVIVMKSDQVAADFQNLPSTVVNNKGMIRVSLKKPDGTFINSDLPAWGYNILVSETDVGSSVPIRAEVFGLPPKAEIRFDFSSLADQVIDPSTKILTVKEINGGATVATITTRIGGPQPLTVTVKRVK